MADIAKRVVLKMETRKFRAPYDWPAQHSSSQMSGLYSLDLDVESCAICLEAYRDGQVGDHGQWLKGRVIFFLRLFQAPSGQRPFSTN